MKYTLIFFLLFFICIPINAQSALLKINNDSLLTKSTEELLDTSYTYVDTNYFGDKIFYSEKAYIERKAMKVLKKYWGEYELICKNDTTWITDADLNIWIRNDPTFIIRYTWYNSVGDVNWFYKTPTSGGFMEFINKKYNL